MVDNSSIKKNIYRFRKAKGLTQEEMASRIGTSVTHYRNIESGKTWLISPVVGKIADVLGIGEDAILTGNGKFLYGGILEDEPSPYSCRGNDMGGKIAQLQSELSVRMEREAGLKARIDEMNRYIGDLRSTIEILKRAKGFENPEKI